MHEEQDSELIPKRKRSVLKPLSKGIPLWHRVPSDSTNAGRRTMKLTLSHLSFDREWKKSQVCRANTCDKSKVILPLKILL